MASIVSTLIVHKQRYEAKISEILTTYYSTPVF